MTEAISTKTITDIDPKEETDVKEINQAMTEIDMNNETQGVDVKEIKQTQSDTNEEVDLKEINPKVAENKEEEEIRLQAEFDLKNIDPKVKEFAIELMKRSDGKVDNDFEAVKLAIVTECDFDKALKRVENCHKFETKHDVKNISFEEAYAKVNEKCPDAFYGFVGKDLDGRIIFSSNYGKFYPSQLLKDPYLERCMLKYFKVMYSVSATNQKELESGMAMYCCTKGAGWKNFSMKMEKEYAWTYQEGYPIRLKKMVVYDGKEKAGMFESGKIIRAIIKLCKAFLTKKMRERIFVIKYKELEKHLSEDTLSQLDEPNKEHLRKLFFERVRLYDIYCRHFKLSA